MFDYCAVRTLRVAEVDERDPAARSSLRPRHVARVGLCDYAVCHFATIEARFVVALRGLRPASNRMSRRAEAATARTRASSARASENASTVLRR